MILTAAVQPFALNDDFTAIHIVTGELAVIEQYLTGGQGGAAGVDKATALTGNA
ncbi:Uncharacterised protein [Yersinia bercovieri]|nr:Uncharacterised protein [Yersinia bercovieri]